MHELPLAKRNMNDLAIDSASYSYRVVRCGSAQAAQVHRHVHLASGWGNTRGAPKTATSAASASAASVSWAGLGSCGIRCRGSYPMAPRVVAPVADSGHHQKK